MNDLKVRGPAQVAIASAEEAARGFGLETHDIAATPPGLLPFAIHNRLVRRDAFLGDKLTTTPFRVHGHTFYWLDRPRPEVWNTIGLRGHEIVSRPSDRLEKLAAALEIIGSRPQALEMVRTFITTFAWVEAVADKSGEPLLTSCSLPDLPLVAFISDMAQRHIPPLTVAQVGSPRLLAENIYHESVHQLVNYRILTEDIFVPEYDSRTSPRVPIAWRASSIRRNQEWELDRVLHAATVYGQLLDWRLHELDCAELSDAERNAISDASLASLESADYLAEVLCRHVDYFTPSGALFVGRLAQSIEQRRRLLHGILGVERAV